MSLSRRHFVCLVGIVTPLAPSVASAHHGWSSFDQDRPLYLEGKVVSSQWQNPHAELIIETLPVLALPADLQQRVLPAQTGGLDGAALLAKVGLPKRRDRRWELELAPLTRMAAWGIAEIKAGAQISAVGFTLQDEKGKAVMRVEYLFVDGKGYGLRSSPA